MKDSAMRIQRPATGMPTNIKIRILVLKNANSNRADFIVTENDSNTAVYEG
jgi:hypothetical protein